MANENNKIKELVADDDDPTAEFDLAGFRATVSADAVIEQESDAHTHGVDDRDADVSSGSQSIPELQQDLDRRTKTIGRLQFDIEQLRAKWLGLETEIGAREDIVNNLNREIDELKNDIARKDKLLKKRKKAIKSLKSKSRTREEENRQLAQDRSELEQELTEYRATESDQVKALDSTTKELEDARSQLRSAAEKIEALEADLEARDQTNEQLKQQHAALDNELSQLGSTNVEQLAAFEKAEKESQRLYEELLAEGVEKDKTLENAESEIRGLRSDLKSSLATIASLESDGKQSDESRSQLEEQHAELKLQLEQLHEATAEKDLALDAAEHNLERAQFELETALNQGPPEIVLANISTSDANAIQAQIARTEEYADTLRHKMQDLAESSSLVSRERDQLNRSLRQMTAENGELTKEIEKANQSIADMQSTLENQHAEMRATLDKQQSDHEQEIRTLRFELDEAQNTVSETSDMNSQLASELMDTRGFKDDLESMLSHNDEQAQERIEELEKQIKRLSAATEDFEQKLDTKSTAINVLLGELAKKSEQIDSIGEIEDVIHDIDDRMSGRIDDSVGKDTTPATDTGHSGNERDRVTRQLVGNVGDQELRFPLFKNRLTIGRTNENDIQLKTSYVSRRHAVVLTEGDSTRVIDWGSKNGVFVNSNRVKEHFLSNGDIVAVGDAEFRYEERQMRDA